MIGLIGPRAIGAEHADADRFGAEGRRLPDVDIVELLQIGRHHAVSLLPSGRVSQIVNPVAGFDQRPRPIFEILGAHFDAESFGQ